MRCCSPRGQTGAQRNHGSETKHGTLFISTCHYFVEHSGQTYVILQLLLFFKPVSFFFFYFTLLVICNFRSATCQALVLEIGETVQILEKSEGEIKGRKCDSEGRWCQLCCILYGNISGFSCCGSLFIPKLIKSMFIVVSIFLNPSSNTEKVQLFTC